MFKRIAFDSRLLTAMADNQTHIEHEGKVEWKKITGEKKHSFGIPA